MLPAHVTGSGSAGDPWRGTQYQIGKPTRTCVAKGTGTGSGAADFNVTAPGEPDASYDATLHRARDEHLRGQRRAPR